MYKLIIQLLGLEALVDLTASRISYAAVERVTANIIARAVVTKLAESTLMKRPDYRLDPNSIIGMLLRKAIVQAILKVDGVDPTKGAQSSSLIDDAFQKVVSAAAHLQDTNLAPATAKYLDDLLVNANNLLDEQILQNGEAMYTAAVNITTSILRRSSLSQGAMISTKLWFGDKSETTLVDSIAENKQLDSMLKNLVNEKVPAYMNLLRADDLTIVREFALAKIVIQILSERGIQSIGTRVTVPSAVPSIKGTPVLFGTFTSYSDKAQPREQLINRLKETLQQQKAATDDASEKAKAKRDADKASKSVDYLDAAGSPQLTSTEYFRVTEGKRR